MEEIPLAPQEPDHGKPQTVGAAGMAGGKNAVGFVIEEGRPGKDDLASPVETIEEIKMGKGFDILEGRRKFRETSTVPSASGRKAPWMGDSSLVLKGV